MLTREELSALVEQYISQLEFNPQPEKLFAPIRYSLEGGGKRIRPLLALMAHAAFSSRTDDVLPCAAAVEVFHNFTLLHDDIMDNAAVRRGKAAVHTKWGANTAILSGDAMLIYAYSLLEKIPTEALSAVFAKFNRMAMEVCEGQQYDMEFEQLPEVAMSDYIKMISLKTSALLGRSVEMGAMIGGASTENVARLYDFAINLGIAFQIEDDLLDTYGEEKTLGKRTGGDIKEGKKTYLTISTIERLGVDQKRAFMALLTDGQMSEQAKFSAVRSVYDSLGIEPITRTAINEYTNKALAALSSIDAPSERVAPLEELAKSLIGRVK